MATELKKVTQLAWRRLIRSEHGIEGMLVLKERAPTVGTTGESHSILFQAGEVQGWNKALKAIYDLVAPDSASDQDFENK